MDVPNEIAKLPQWMLWRLEHGTKVPYQINGQRGKSNDPICWSTLEECEESHSPRSGVAFVFCESDPYCGIDLDDCINDGVYEPWAQEIINRFEGVAYCETSPSGTGVKLTTRAKKPAASKCSNGKGVECYDNKRFWTWTGKCIGAKYSTIGDGQQAVEWLIEKHLQAGERKTAGARLEAPTVAAPRSLIDRAKTYCDSVPGSAKGGLRNAAFSLSGHLHSIVGEHGERLSDHDVLDLLSSWNFRNSDQLREDELQEAAVNGRKNGTPPAEKLPIASIPVDHGIDFSEFRIPGGTQPESNRNPTVIESEPPPMFPADCLRPPGILTEIVDYTLSKSMYPQPELAIAGALALLATVTGRKIQSEYGTRTNIYALGLAPSGAGKEQARKTNKELLNAAGGAHLIGPERIASSAGLTSFVASQLSPLFQLDEVGRLLATMKNASASAPHLYNIGTVLMQLFSSSDQTWIGDAYADAKKTPKIDQPHAVVYGTAVPDGFWDGMTKESISDGLLGRMMIFEAAGYVTKNRPKLIEPPLGLIESIQWWVEFKPGGNMSREFAQPITAHHTDEARDRYESHLDAIDERKKTDGVEGAALWSRAGEKVAKLALLFAISRQPCEERIAIDLCDVNLAIRLSNWLTRRMLEKAGLHVAKNEIESSRKKMLQIVMESPEGKIRLNELTRKTQWLGRRSRSEYLDELRDMGLIELETETTIGRPATWVRYVKI
jgi:hypothetical protein